MITRPFAAAVLCLVALAACDSDDDGESAKSLRGKACPASNDCGEGLACVEGVCRESCGASYYSATQCLGNEFCKPFAGEATGFCAPSECDIDTDCSSGQACANVKTLVSACITPCTATFVDGSYEDDCPGKAFCQKIGQGAQRRLMCAPSATTGQAIGTFCNPTDLPCATNQSYLDGNGQTVTFGLTCVNSQCMELCDPSVPNPATNEADCGASVARGATYCCEQTGANGFSWGVCLPVVNDAGCQAAQY